MRLNANSREIVLSRLIFLVKWVHTIFANTLTFGVGFSGKTSAACRLACRTNIEYSNAVSLANIVYLLKKRFSFIDLLKFPYLIKCLLISSSISA